MSDTVITTDREALKSAIIYLEKALAAFKQGLNLEINTAQKAVETAKTAPTEAAQKVEVPKKEPEKPAVSIEEVRKVFAKIMLDPTIDGKALIKATLDKYKVTKVSEFKPEQYGAALEDTVESYEEELAKKERNLREKILKTQMRS